MDACNARKEFDRLNPKTINPPLLDALLERLQNFRNFTGDYLLQTFKVPCVGFNGTVVDLAAAFTILIRDMKHCYGISDFVMTILTLIRNITNKTFTEIYASFNVYLKFFAKTCFSSVTTVFQNGDYFQPRAEGGLEDPHDYNMKTFINQLRNTLCDYSNLANSEIATRFSTFISLVVCMPICKSLGITTQWFGFPPLHQKMCQRIYDRKHKNTVIYEVLDSSLYVIEKMILMFESKSVKCLYIEDSELRKYDEEFTFLTYYYDKLELVSNQGMTLMDYYTRCDNLLQLGDRIKKLSPSNKFGDSMIKSHQNMLARCKLRCGDKLKIESERNPPLAFVLYGTPGIGKSALIDKILTICYQNAKYLGHSSLDYDVKMKYAYNADDEYMSEFHSGKQVLVMDDVDQYLPIITQGDRGGAIRNAISFINPVPYVTNQAELANKGMIPFLCEYVVMTTNTVDAGISNVFNKHGGAKRRLLFLDVNVKPEYRKPGETQLAGDKDNDFNHEMHEFVARKYESVGDKHNTVYWCKEESRWKNTKTSTMSLRELSQFLLEQIQKPHYQQSDVAKKSVEQFIAAPFCDSCLCSTALCGHAVVESGVGSTKVPTVDEEDYDPWSTHLMFIQTLVRLAILSQLRILFYVPTLLCILKFYFFNMFTGGSQTRTMRWIFYFINWLPNRTPWFLRWLPVRAQCWISKHRWLWWFNTTDHFKKAHSMYSHAQFVKCQRLVAHGCMAYVLLITCFSLYTASKSHFTFSKKGDDDEEAQGGYVSTDAKHVDKVNEVSATEPYWIRRTMDLTSVSGPMANITYDNLVSLAANNTCHIKLYNTKNANSYFVTGGLGLYGNTIIIAAHVLDSLDKAHFITIIRHNQEQQVGPSRYKLVLTDDCIIRHPKYDYCLIKHPGFGCFRDIRKFLGLGTMNGLMKGELITRDAKGILEHKPVHRLEAGTFNYTGFGKVYTSTGYTGRVDIPSRVGNCGSPYVVRTKNGSFIAGIHVAGKPGRVFNSVYCLPIDLLDTTTNYFEPHSPNGLDLNDHYSSNVDLTLHSEVHEKCPLNEVQGAAEVCGFLHGHRPKPKTYVRPTLMAEDVLEEYNLPGLQHFSPKLISARNAVKLNVSKCLDKAVVNPDVIHKCEDGLFRWYSRVIRENKIYLPSKPYDIDVGINGLDGVNYIDRLPVKTSGGFGHKGSKLKYFVDLEPTKDHEVRYGLSPEIQQEYDKLVASYLKGESGKVVFDYNYKDEPLSADKVAKNKCRLFSSGPLHFTILVRQYFFWCIPLFSGKLRHKFGSAIGTNCIGSDWDTIYHHITKFGVDNIIAGDYGSYDKVMPPEVMCSAFNVLIRIAYEHGWSQNNLTIMRGIATDICYPLTNVFGSVVRFFGTNPSGHSLTTPINGMCNILYIMMASVEICEEKNKPAIDLSRFDDYVSIVTYGDDNAMSSNLSYINHTNLSETLAKHGIEYTMADKTSASVPFVSVEDIEFLKRKFVPDPNFPGKFAAPLNEESIIKMLSMCTQSRTILFETQCAEILDAACREYFQYGRDKFESKRQWLTSVGEKHGLLHYMNSGELPTYNELYTSISQYKIHTDANSNKAS
nr:hypothetical protein 1 [Mute swan feces associated picorna-like virus 18]